MIKRTLILTSLLFAMICAGWAGGGHKAEAAAPPANEDQGGATCDPYPVYSCWAIPVGGGRIVWECNTWWIWPCN